jgi:hypothetical protein
MTATLHAWLARHAEGVLVAVIVASLLAIWLFSGCVQARAPGSVAALTIFGSRYAVAGATSNQVNTVEGGASPSTTATVPLR